MFESSVAMITSQQPSSAAFPAKLRPDHHPRPAAPGPRAPPIGRRPGSRGRTRPASRYRRERPAAPLGEEHHRALLTFGELEESVLLRWFWNRLGAREAGVVAGHHDSRMTVDLGHAADKPVGRGVSDEVVDRPAAPLGRDGEGPVLHEGPRIAEVRDDSPARCAERCCAAGRRLPGPPRPGEPVSAARLGQRRGDLRCIERADSGTAVVGLPRTSGGCSGDLQRTAPPGRTFWPTTAATLRTPPARSALTAHARASSIH